MQKYNHTNTKIQINSKYFQRRAATGAVVAALIKEAQLEMEFAKMRGDHADQ